ncbi:DNA oxidative demethylase AlkB [Ochrobactrum sp. RH2CCR150]|uniref:DNA oxidative demethylase AlkB n=1 Tax=Ochrobactrum sp. RH2CCR150 TaxID=2587044 RepID=UPI0015FD318A|nr:alkylated DNA repair protein (DNA oxidative demethylase) [Ochrobactrum sp. RH2CCR150]
MRDLFDQLEPVEILAPGAVLMHGFALADEDAILKSVADVSTAAPFRHMVTPGGYRMSVAMTNCGQAGWVTDKSGYRYSAEDPETGKPWPAMPEAFRNLAENAARQAGYDNFSPDACLINRYEPGAKLSLHQDKDERDFTNPIVSVSLGLPATFQFGGLKRNDPITKYPLHHGDVVVWGGPSRLFHHGILALKDGEHDKVGRVRLNLTFRKAL